MRPPPHPHPLPHHHVQPHPHPHPYHSTLPLPRPTPFPDLDCYKNALLGDAAYNLSAMGREDLLAPWVGGFAPGGCPIVRPAACEGPQCGSHRRPPDRDPMVEMVARVRSAKA